MYFKGEKKMHVYTSQNLEKKKSVVIFETRIQIFKIYGE